jgi:hypothetical protein
VAVRWTPIKIESNGMSPARLPDRLLSMPRTHVPLAIDEIGAYPVLAGCLEAWRKAATGRLPETIDPVEMPIRAIKGISLVDWNEETDEWIVRLSSTLMDEGVGSPMTGRPLANAFPAEEFEGVVNRLDEILNSGEPSLARHEFTDQRGRRWSYIRLVLPLSRTGGTSDRYAVIYDPDSFGQRIGPEPRARPLPIE